MPKVTVLMPTYNVAPWVEEAIRSVLAQTYTDFTLLVLDDCSSDNTLEVVRSINDPRIRIVAGENNLGLADNLNRGLELSDTEYCARMDGDDIAEPTWLETGVKVLDAHSEIGICSFGFQFFGTKHSVVRFPEENEASKAQMLFGCTVIVPVFRRSVMIDNGLRYRTETFPAEDYDMWSRCYRVTQVYNVQQTMFHYRMHESQITTSRRLAQMEKANIVRLDMLHWLNPAFTEEEQFYFIDVFVPCKISNYMDVQALKRFAALLVERNTLGHYSTTALRQKFQFHISYGTLDFVEQHFFSKGYSPLGLGKMIFQGYWFELPRKNRMKILVKSFLFPLLRRGFTKERG